MEKSVQNDGSPWEEGKSLQDYFLVNYLVYTLQLNPTNLTVCHGTDHVCDHEWL